MKHLLSLFFCVLVTPAWATVSTRATLHSNSVPTPTLLGQVIDSTGNLGDSNTWTGANSFTGAVSFTNPPTSSASLPAISSCGTTPPAASAGSNAAAGQFTLGTGTPTACTVTFATAYATISFCTVTPASSGGAAITGGYYLSANDKTGFTITLGTGTSSLIFNYTCAGN
jgi:hypothetical protein